MSDIESVLQEHRVFPPPAEFAKQANISGMAAYEALCAEAEKDYEGFWARLARENILWHKPFSKTLDQSNAPFFKWFSDGELNISYNCLDRHLNSRPNKVAIIFEADDGTITYKQLYHCVCQFANGLKSLGIKTGDRRGPDDGRLRSHQERGGLQAHWKRDEDGIAARRLAVRPGAEPARRMRTGLGQCRAPAVHRSLYPRLDRQAQGRTAFQHRLFTARHAIQVILDIFW